MMKSLVIVSKALAPYRVGYYREVAQVLKSQGWRVTLLAASTGATDHPWSDASGGTDGLSIVAAGWQKKNSGLGGLIRKLTGVGADVTLPNASLLSFLEGENPDVVWTHEYSPFCLAAAAWARWRGRTSILSTELGDSPPAYACTRLQLFYHKLMAGLYDKVIAQTMEATRRSHPVGAPVCFAPHAISTGDYIPMAGATGDLFRFLFIGALDQRKGVDRVLEAGRRLFRQGHSFQLRVFGSGTLGSWLQVQPDPWLFFGGFVEGLELREEYRRADSYVLPTREDTYAVTVHEAAASGLPLIIGRNAGARETLVEEGITGFSVDADDIDAITERMAYLLENREKARKMGEAARARAVDFDVGRLGRHTADFIAGSVSSPSVR